MSLPLSLPTIHHLTVLEPVMTILPLNAHLRNHIVVVRESKISLSHPPQPCRECVSAEFRAAVVCFVSDYEVIRNLKANEEEVDRIFTHPLRGVLEGRVDAADADTLVERGSEWWPHEEEYHVSERSKVDLEADSWVVNRGPHGGELLLI